MDGQSHSPHYTRQLTLPSGRRIEVVYFDAAASDQETEQQELHRCGGCGCQFVQPVDWSAVSKSFWSVTLECPNCRWSGTGVFGQQVVDRFDEELNRGSAVLAEQARQLSLENMADSIERFVAALRDDQIVPGDF
jgi:hypothetical protein